MSYINELCRLYKMCHIIPSYFNSENILTYCIKTTVYKMCFILFSRFTSIGYSSQNILKLYLKL